MYIFHMDIMFDTSTKYNVLYLMHGGGDNEDLYLEGQTKQELKKIIDNMIVKGDITTYCCNTNFNGGKMMPASL